MAFGFPAKYKRNFQLNSLDAVEQFWAIAIEAVKNLGWNIQTINENCIIAKTEFSFLSFGEIVSFNIKNTTVCIESRSCGLQILDLGKNEDNILYFLLRFEKIEKFATKEYVRAKIAEFKGQFLNPQNEVDISSPPSPLGLSTEKEINLFTFLIPHKNYFITPILIYTNVLIFIIMAFSGVNIINPSGESLLAWGANYRPVTLNGESWRLLTACFLHGGMLHLAANMGALFFIGLILEPYLGRVRFLVTYLLVGIIASLTSLWWHNAAIAVGASGAILGMYGVFLALLTTNLIEKSVRKTFWISTIFFVFYNLFYGLKGNIDNAAHIGGLLSGIVMGFALIPSLKKATSNTIKYITLTVLTVAILFFSTTILKTFPNKAPTATISTPVKTEAPLSKDLKIYNKKMEEFRVVELMALEFYDMPSNTPKEKMLSEIKMRGLYYWNENIILIDSLNKLDLPKELKDRNLKLKEYCEIRIKCYNAIYKKIDEDTNKYDADIKVFNTEIDELLKTLDSTNY